MKTPIGLLMLTVAGIGYCQDTPALDRRVAELEKELADLKQSIAPLLAEARTKRIVEEKQALARRRMRADSRVYSNDELREIENLYQVANREWNSAEARESLETLITKYGEANRTGCAVLYLGQMSEGKEQEDYLSRAIADFSDCFYGDGVQVGAYARYYLANYYKTIKADEKAEQLLGEIEASYPDAVDHRGRLLSETMRQ
jgi:hypothetical protein